MTLNPFKIYREYKRRKFYKLVIVSLAEFFKLYNEYISKVMSIQPKCESGTFDIQQINHGEEIILPFQTGIKDYGKSSGNVINIYTPIDFKKLHDIIEEKQYEKNNT